MSNTNNQLVELSELTFRKKAIQEYDFFDKMDLLKRIHTQLDDHIGDLDLACTMEIFCYNIIFIIKDRGLMYLGSVICLSIGAI